MKEAKQVIVMRKDLNMRRGKQIAQGAHASLAVILKMMSKTNQLEDSDFNDVICERLIEKKTLKILKNTPLEAWLNGSFTKICCYVDSEKELKELYDKAKEVDLLCSFIEDRGFTEFKGVKTATCIAIGPGWVEDIDKITKQLPLL